MLPKGQQEGGAFAHSQTGTPGDSWPRLASQIWDPFYSARMRLTWTADRSPPGRYAYSVRLQSVAGNLRHRSVSGGHDGFMFSNGCQECGS
jgi:hypothetical protein